MCATLAGELDDWGGHAGRADDYHYHMAPLHLQEIVGRDQPIAYALAKLPHFTVAADLRWRNLLLTAIQDRTLASAELNVHYAR